LITKHVYPPVFFLNPKHSLAALHHLAHDGNASLRMRLPHFAHFTPGSSENISARYPQLEQAIVSALIFRLSCPGHLFIIVFLLFVY